MPFQELLMMVPILGAEISVVNVRKASDVSGVHGTYKPPCDVCQPLIDFFGIKDINIGGQYDY